MKEELIRLEYFLENLKEIGGDMSVNIDWPIMTIRRKTLLYNLAKFIVSLENSPTTERVDLLIDVKHTSAWAISEIMKEMNITGIDDNFPFKTFHEFAMIGMDELQKLVNDLEDKNKLRRWLKNTFKGILFIRGGLKRGRNENRIG